MPKHNHQCLSCAYCQNGKLHSIDGHCPAHCLLHSTSYGNKCNAWNHHNDCDDSAFCSFIPSFEFKCLPCALCSKPGYAADNRCPTKKCTEHAELVKSILSEKGTADHLKAEQKKLKDLQVEEARWKRAVHQNEKTLEKELAAAIRSSKQSQTVTKAFGGLLILATCGFIAYTFINRKRVKLQIEQMQEAMKQMQRDRAHRYEGIELGALAADFDEETDCRSANDLPSSP
jgi:hypothetical protein